MTDNCIFCNTPPEKIVVENDLVYARYDEFAVTPYHTLIIPKRHCLDMFDLYYGELQECMSLMHEIKTIITGWDKTVEGFNIGANCGAVAGQTVMHCHIHLIPRRKGDVENPRGGVRHIIPGKGFYYA
jgi:ATP adenylyltransferase